MIWISDDKNYRRKEKEENKNNDVIAYIKSYLNKSEYLYWTKWEAR